MAKRTQNQTLGQKGESLACKFLEKNNHQILFRNYRTGRSELDIISLFGDDIVVSEVKSFHSIPLGAPEYRVNKQKQKQIIRGIYGFLDENPKLQGKDVRIDVIIVDFSNYPARIIQHKGVVFEDGNVDS
jgi:putative endonuclease